MKYYLGEVNQFLAPKNKLEKAIQHYMKEFDRKLISEKRIEDYKTEIITNIKIMNTEHPKCTPVDPSWWTPATVCDEQVDWIISGVDCVRFLWACSKEVKL